MSNLSPVFAAWRRQVVKTVEQRKAETRLQGWLEGSDLPGSIRTPKVGRGYSKPRMMFQN